MAGNVLGTWKKARDTVWSEEAERSCARGWCCGTGPGATPGPRETPDVSAQRLSEPCTPTPSRRLTLVSCAGPACSLPLGRVPGNAGRPGVGSSVGAPDAGSSMRGWQGMADGDGWAASTVSLFAGPFVMWVLSFQVERVNFSVRTKGHPRSWAPRPGQGLSWTFPPTPVRRLRSAVTSCPPPRPPSPAVQAVVSWPSAGGAPPPRLRLDVALKGPGGASAFPLTAPHDRGSFP